MSSLVKRRGPRTILGNFEREPLRQPTLKLRNTWLGMGPQRRVQNLMYPENFISPSYILGIFLRFVRHNFGNRRTSRAAIGVFLSFTWFIALVSEHSAVFVLIFLTKRDRRTTGNTVGKLDCTFGKRTKLKKNLFPPAICF